MGHTENNEDGRVMSELIDNIGNAVNDCQVSGSAQTGSAT